MPARTPPRTPPPAQQPPPKTHAAAVTTAVGAGTLLPPEAVAGVGGLTAALTAAEIAKSVTAILGAFDLFNSQRTPQIRQQIIQTIARLYPERTPEEVRELVRDEMAREVEFQRKQRERLEQDLPEAMKIEDPVKRQERIDAILKREKRWEQMREEAAAKRSAALAGFMTIRDTSPEGAFWLLGKAREHTPDCVAMSNNFWPWSVLKRIHPLLHAGCQCSLIGKDEAVRLGLMHPDQVPDEKDAQKRAAEIARRFNILNEIAEPEEIEGYLREILEFDPTKHPRDRRGEWQGVPGRKLVHDSLRALIPQRPMSPAAHRREGTGEWRSLGGVQAFVPQHRRFDREVGGMRFTSPPGTTAVTAGPVVARARPDIPEDRDSRIKAAADAERSAWREEARGIASRALAAQDPEIAPALVGAHSRSTHTGLIDAGFRPHRMEATSTHDVRHYTHPLSGARVTVGYNRMGDQGVGYVNWEPGSKEMSPGEPIDHPPRSWEEFTQDVLNVAHAIGNHYGHQADARRVVADDSLIGHAGSHDWHGVTRLGRDVRRGVEGIVKARAEGRSMTHSELRRAYGAYRTGIHEALHAAHPIDSSLYGGSAAARGLEESLTEELSSIYTAEVLRRQGLTDVLAFARANPVDTKVEGDYSLFRDALAKTLREADVPPEGMHDVIEHLKFGVAPMDRPDTLASMMSQANGAGHVENLGKISRFFGNVSAATDEGEWIKFPPLVRPDLSGIPEPETVHIGGHEVYPGSWVELKREGMGRVQKIVATSPALLDVVLPTGVVKRNVGQAEVLSVRPGPGRETIGHAADLGGQRIVRGDRVSWASPSGRTYGRIERVARVDPVHLEATTEDGKPVVLTQGRSRGLRREDLAEAVFPNDPKWFGQHEPVKCFYCESDAKQRVIRSEGQVSVAVCGQHVDTAKDSPGDEVRDLDPLAQPFLHSSSFVKDPNSTLVPALYRRDVADTNDGEWGDVPEGLGEGIEEAVDEMVAPGTVCAVCGRPATHVASGAHHDVFACPNQAHQDFAAQMAGTSTQVLPVDDGPLKTGIQFPGIVESDFDPTEHPRGRLGKWVETGDVDSIEHAIRHYTAARRSTLKDYRSASHPSEVALASIAARSHKETIDELKRALPVAKIAKRLLNERDPEELQRGARVGRGGKGRKGVKLPAAGWKERVQELREEPIIGQQALKEDYRRFQVETGGSRAEYNARYWDEHAHPGGYQTVSGDPGSLFEEQHGRIMEAGARIDAEVRRRSKMEESAARAAEKLVRDTERERKAAREQLDAATAQFAADILVKEFDWIPEHATRADIERRYEAYRREVVKREGGDEAVIAANRDVARALGRADQDGRLSALKLKWQDLGIARFTAETDARKAKLDLHTARRDHALDVLHELRPFASPGSLRVGPLYNGADSDELAMQRLSRATMWLPKDWIDDSNAAVAEKPLVATLTQRGKYRHSHRPYNAPSAVAVIEGSDSPSSPGVGDGEGVMLHELVHRSEYVRDGIRGAEWTFYTGRVSPGRNQRWEEAKPLRETEGVDSFDPSERARSDDFVDRYAGKTYGDDMDSSYEILSMGIEDLVTGRHGITAQDEEYRQFVFGALALL